MSAQDPEELFPPIPGGMVDTARKKAKADADQLAAANSQQGAEVQEGPYTAIRTRPAPCDSGNVRTITLSAQYPYARLLAADPNRRSAVILAIDADVYVTGNLGLATDVSLLGTATSGQVGYFPAGIGIPIDNQAEYWVVATTTATLTRVTVIINRDTRL